jgi:hypothetical protein
MLGPRPSCARAVVAVCAVLALAGCGGSESPARELSFESLPDTAGLTTGPALMQEFTVERMDSGALRVSGRATLPDGTRLRITLRESSDGASRAMAEAPVLGGRFDTPPLIGEYGPLPRGRYRVEVLAHFTPDAQPDDVLRQTDEGRALRGPGITRGRDGRASYFVSQEVTR